MESRFVSHRGVVGGHEVGDNEIKRILRSSDDVVGAPRGVGGVEDGRRRGLRRRARARAPAQRGRSIARVPGLVRAGGGDDGDERGQAVRHAGRDRPGDQLGVRPLEARARRVAGGALRVRGVGAAAVALRRPVLPGGAGRGWRRARPRLLGSRSRRADPAHLRRARSRDCRHPRAAATSTRATARASMRSASTSIARGTSACSATSSTTPSGWTRCCTSSGTASSAPGTIPTLPWLLRDCHLTTTEGIAILMGRLAADREWLQRVAGLSDGRGGRPRAAAARRPRGRARRLRPLGPRDDELRAGALRQPRGRSRRDVVGARGALPAADSP